MRVRFEEDYRDFCQLMTFVYQKIEREASNYRNLFPMLNVLDRYEPLIYIDESHLTPVGNHLIADRMLTILDPPYSSKTKSEDLVVGFKKGR